MTTARYLCASGQSDGALSQGLGVCGVVGFSEEERESLFVKAIQADIDGMISAQRGLAHQIGSGLE